MDLNAISIFVRVVQAGSFSGAAQILALPKSTVSAKVSQLEKSLGVTLLRRTTRKLSLTEIGQPYFQICAQALAEINQAQAATTHSAQEPQGLLKVTAPAELGMGTLGRLFGTFLEQYPKVEIELLLTDRVVDLVGENVDVAIRGGELKDSSLISKKVGVGKFQLFTSSAYSQKHPLPKIPEELVNHQCLRFSNLARNHIWELCRGEKTVAVEVTGRFSANNILALRELVTSGQGIALLPVFLCLEEVKLGQLIPVLPGWTTQLRPIHIVYPAQRFVPHKVKVFVQFFHQALQNLFQ